jgi:penicillin amidase
VNKTQYNLSDTTFKTVWGVSMRRIVDLADPEHPQTILTLGQSGQVFSPHYSDQFDWWLHGQYKTVSMEPTEFTRSKHTLILTPEPRP